MEDQTEKELKISKYLISELKTPELIVPINTIKKIFNIYKNNFSSAKNFSELNSKFNEFQNELELSHAAKCEIEKQYKKGLGLQPSILTECYMAQTIAHRFGLNKFADIDNSNANAPVKILNTLFQPMNKKDEASFRYIYFDDKADKIIAQCGDSSTIDAVFVKEKTYIRIEFKEELAKINEVDIPSYDNDGKLVITDAFKWKYPYYVPFVEIFNRETNVFKMIGHNFSIDKFLDERNSKFIIDSVVDAKFINVYVLLKKSTLIPVLADELYSKVGFAGSEIRTAGKNPKKLWSVDFAKSEIARLGGKIENGKVTLPIDEKSYSVGRGTDVVTRYKINPLIFVRITNAKQNERTHTISFDFDSIEQLKPTVSLHLSPR